MVSEHGLPSVPHGLDRELSSFLNQMRTLVLRNAKAIRNPDKDIKRTHDIQDLSITKDKLFKGSVTQEKIADGAITANKIKKGSISSDLLADGCITNEKIAEGSVEADKIADGAITTNKLAVGVSDDLLSGLTVTNAMLEDNSVTSSKIANGAVTADKLADGILDNDLVIEDGKIEFRHFSDNCVEAIRNLARSAMVEPGN